MEIIINASFDEFTNQIKLNFDPDDLEFAKGVFNAIWRLSRLQKKLDKTSRELSGAACYDEVVHIESLIRETIDGALGAPVCERLLGDYSPCIRNKSGKRFWEHIMFSVAERLSVRRAIKQYWSLSLTQYQDECLREMRKAGKKV